MADIRLQATLLAALLGIATHSTAQFARSAATGAFPDTSLIESQLHRGVSTESDVQRLLGVPNGSGRAEMALPPSRTADLPTGPGPRDIWYYDDIQITRMKSGWSTVDMEERQQILIVFFRAGIFDGYLWTSNVLPATAHQ